MQQPVRFGEELRRRRLVAGLTLTSLARQVHYSKGQLSKVERGIKMPSRDLARLCDAVLDAGGTLTSLVHEKPSGTEVAVAIDGDEEVWLMRLGADGDDWFQPMSRRQMMTAGVSSIPAISIGKPGASITIESATLLGIFRSVFDHYRQLGQAVEPGLLLPVLIAQTHTIQELSRRTQARTRRDLLILGSRYAEYVGWLLQERGNEQAALWWTRRAADMAAAGGDQDFAAYGLVRHALVTLYRDDGEQTIELARSAQNRGVSSRVRGLAAQREAQGHALAGDYDACMRSLARARTLLAQDASESDAPVIGTTNLADPAEMIRGWCLYDLGRPRAAAEIIESQVSQVAHGAQRARLRYGVRCALAHAAAGDLDHACRLTASLLGDALTVGSATTATDLRKLAHTLARHPRNASVRDLEPRLGTALRTVTSWKRGSQHA